jgi:hypothetical protein
MENVPVMAGVDAGCALVLFAPNVNPPPVDATGVALLSVVADTFALSSPAAVVRNVKAPAAGVLGVELLAAAVAGGLLLVLSDWPNVNPPPPVAGVV